MQTRRLVRHRFVFCALAFVIGAAAIAPRARAQSEEGRAAGAQSQSRGVVAPSDAAHYDPDDNKTYDDVAREDRAITLRGRRFVLHLYRPANENSVTPIIYACGDGGWRGLAPRTAEQLAHLGAAVVGVDSKIYLRDFSSPSDPLTPRRIAEDYAELAQTARTLARVDATHSLYVSGWSEGAGLAVAAASVKEMQSNWAGIITIGLPAQNQLTSGVAGNKIDLNVAANARYGFLAERQLSALAPLPLVMIQSTNDTASPLKTGRQLFAAAVGPKKFVLIKANNHRFSGGREEFYSALGDAIAWIREARTRPFNHVPVRAASDLTSGR